MNNFIASPNLPDAPVGLVLVKDDKTVVTALHRLGIRTLSPVPDPALPEETAEHADMLFCHAGNGLCIVAPSQTALRTALEKEGFSVFLSSAPGGTYPQDVLLNAAVTKSVAAGNFRYTDPVLLGLLQNRKLLNVKQGYAKCSVCFVTENAVITEDEGIAAAFRKEGAEVLLISKGDIFLSETHYGFFGGCSGKLDKDLLAVTGKLSSHRDGEKIKAFAHRHGAAVTELTDGVLTDIGGILPLKIHTKE